jgi:hypothetical protein
VKRSSLSPNLRCILRVQKLVRLGITATNCRIDISIYPPTYGKKYIRIPWAVVSKYIVTHKRGLLHCWLSATWVEMSLLL